MLPRLQNKFIANLIIGRRFLKSFNVCLAFPEKWFVFLNQIWPFKALNQDSATHKIRFRLLTNFKANLQETQIQGERFWRVSTFASLPQKKGFVFVNQIWHFKDLNQYSVAHKIRFKHQTDFKTSLQETQIQGEGF